MVRGVGVRPGSSRSKKLLRMPKSDLKARLDSATTATPSAAGSRGTHRVPHDDPAGPVDGSVQAALERVQRGSHDGPVQLPTVPASLTQQRRGIDSAPLSPGWSCRFPMRPYRGRSTLTIVPTVRTSGPCAPTVLRSALCFGDRGRRVAGRCRRVFRERSPSPGSATGNGSSLHTGRSPDVGRPR